MDDGDCGRTAHRVRAGGTAQKLALGWRRLTRAATIVALVTAVPVFVWLTQQRGWSWWMALLGTLALVIAARGIVDLVFHRMIPWPSLFGVDSAELREEDVVARRRVWFWRFWLKIGIFGGIIAFLCWRFLDAAIIVQILPLLIILPIFMLFNFAILFGPLLIMNLSQIQAFEPGDAQWGVKLSDVRGQVEAKEEVRRVVSIWQSGDQFEQRGGKRERGLLFLGAPGTGKTMLAKALATGFNSPFVSIPGSGFAATFIGIDAIVVRIVARRAKKLARKWGGQCIVFIDEIDAVGMRRNDARPGWLPTGSTPLSLDDPQHLFFGPFGALNPSGDLILETRVWRERMFAERHTPQIGINGYQLTSCGSELHVPGRHGQGRRARPQPAARRDGRHRQPAVLQEVLHEQAQHAARRCLHRPAQHRGPVASPAARRGRARSRSTSSARPTSRSRCSTRR